MGLLKNLLKSTFSKKSIQYADMLNGFTPIFSQFGNNVYASDVVQQAISCIVQEISKLQPTHVRSDSSDMIPISQNGIQNVLDRPNPIMCKSDFLEKITWQLMFNYNAFIVPVYTVWTDSKGNEQRNYKALYPVQPKQVDFIRCERYTFCQIYVR